MLDSSFKHHTANMRLLLITLTIFASTLALPHIKQKRDILPGDPRYGTEHDHHHHHHEHENAVVETKTIGGYEYSTSAPLSEAYGPPGYEAGIPLNNDYLPPVDNGNYHISHTDYNPHEVVEVREGPKTFVGRTDTIVQKTVTPATVTVEKTQELNVAPPSTSYGVPVEKHLDTVHTHVDTTNNGVTVAPAVKVVEHAPAVNVVEHAPAVNVVEHAPTVVQDTRHYTTGVTAAPAVTTFETKNLVGNGFVNGGLSNVHRTYEGSYSLPSYHGVPSTFYGSPQTSFETTSNGYGGLALNGGGFVRVHQQLPVQFTKSFPTTYSFPQTIEHVQPIHTSLPSVSSLASSYARVHPVETISTVQPTYTPVHAVHSVDSYAPVQTVHAVDNYAPVHSVESYAPVQPVHTVEAVKRTEYATAAPIQTIRTVHTSHPVEAKHTVTGVVKTNSVPVVQNQVHVQKGAFGDFVENVGSFLPQFPSLPSLPAFGGFSTTPGPAVEVSSPASHVVEETLDNESISVHAPGLSKTVVSSANEYVQPTDANGGYIY